MQTPEFQTQCSDWTDPEGTWMKRFQHWAKIANHPNLPLVRFVSFLFLILLEWITSSLGVPLSPSPYRVPIPKTTAFISSNIQKLHALLVSPDKTKTKNTITQVISNQVPQVVVIIFCLTSQLHWRIETLSFLSLALPAFLPSAILIFFSSK